MGRLDKKTRLPRICRNCYYRRNLSDNSFYRGQSILDSCCAYIIIENTPRGCTPTDGECAKFKPRTRTKSLTGKHKTIK